MFYVLNILQLWTLPTVLCLPLINYWMFNQNLEPNVVIYEHAAVPKYLGSAPKFGECWVQNQIPALLEDPRISPWVLWDCQFHLCWWMEGNLTTGETASLPTLSLLGLPGLFPQFPDQQSPTICSFWEQEGPHEYPSQEHSFEVVKQVKNICWDKYILFF